MDFNTFLNRFGISSENFVNKENEPIPFSGGYIYEVEQRRDIHVCPECGSTHAHVMGSFYTEVNCSQNEHIKDVLRIKKIRFRCADCGKTYVNKIKGIEPKTTITDQVMQFIINDFRKPYTFQQISKRYNFSRSRILELFDEKIPFVPRREMPEILCIDEIRFSEDIEQKYCCVLYDFIKKEIVDIIKNRQLPYLKEYFSNISLEERNKTKVFISDMYDAYATVCSSYFKNAIHIVDKFHIVTQLTRAVNQLRVKTMNVECSKGSQEYNFMKTNWKYFLCHERKIPNKIYWHKQTNKEAHYDDLVFKCIQLNQDLWSGYTCLQDLYNFSHFSTNYESISFIDFLSKKLINTNNETLIKVGETFKKWKKEIANAYTVNIKKINYTNAIAESINNQLKTIIKSANGYKNFDRFRRRAMLIITYSKPK